MIAFAALTSAPLSLDDHVAAVAGPAHGAVATFLGTVRDHDPSADGTVVALEYSAHPDAESVLTQVVASCDSPAVTIAVTHRVATLAVGDAAIAVAVASAHRAEAIATMAALLDRIKAEVPLWKREVLADGSHVWVGIA